MQSLNVVEVPVRVCANCANWLAPTAEVNRYFNYAPEYRRCSALSDECDGSIAFLSDGDSTGLGLMTKGNFGCVLFEAKEEA